MRLHAGSPREPNFRKRERGKKNLTVQAAERPRPVVPDEPGQQVGGEEDEPVRVPGPQGLPPQGLAPAAAPARLRASCLGHGHFRPAARSSRRRCSRAEAWSAPPLPLGSARGFLRGASGGALAKGGRRLVTPAMPREIRARKGKVGRDGSCSRAARCSDEALRSSTAVTVRGRCRCRSVSLLPALSFALRL